MKISFIWNFLVFVVKFSVYLNRRVSVMTQSNQTISENYQPTKCHYQEKKSPRGTKKTERWGINKIKQKSKQIYSKTSMARTSLGPWKVIREMGSQSHWGLIMSGSKWWQFKEVFVIFYTIIVCCVYSLESPRWGDSNEYTQAYNFIINRENFPNFFSWAIGRFLYGFKNVWISHGKWAISIRAIDVWLNETNKAHTKRNYNRGPALKRSVKKINKHSEDLN